MAVLEVTTNETDDFIMEFARFGDQIFEVAKRVVDSTASITLPAYKSAIASSAGNLSDGGTSGSSYVKKAKKNAWGVFDVTLVGKGGNISPYSWGHKYTRFGLRAGVLQYGRADGIVYAKNGNRSYHVPGYPAKKWYDKAVNTAKGPAEAQIRKAFEEEAKAHLAKSLL